MSASVCPRFSTDFYIIAQQGINLLIRNVSCLVGSAAGRKNFQVKGHYYADCCYLLLENYNKTGRDRPIQQKCPVDRDGDPPLHIQSFTIT